jgi:hypothetical protein
MKPSDIIASIRPASFPEKSGAMVLGVSGGRDVQLPYIQAGWANYADSQYTSGAPLAIAAGAKTQLTINGAGAATNTAYANGMPADVWSGNRFRPSGLGEAYNVRITATVTQSSSGAGHYVTFDADIGTDETPFMSASQSIPLIKGQGVPTLVTLAAPFFCLDTFGRNGARFYLTPSVDVQVYGAAVFIQRTFKP